MKIKIGRSAEKNNRLKTLRTKLGTNKRRNITRFVTFNEHSQTTILAQTQQYSNPSMFVEAERQQCSGLLYANITKFR